MTDDQPHSVPPFVDVSYIVIFEWTPQEGYNNHLLVVVNGDPGLEDPEVIQLAKEKVLGYIDTMQQEFHQLLSKLNTEDALTPEDIEEEEKRFMEQLAQDEYTGRAYERNQPIRSYIVGISVKYSSFVELRRGIETTTQVKVLHADAVVMYNCD